MKPKAHKKNAKNRRSWRVIRTRSAGVIYITASIVLGVISVNSGNNLLYLVTALMLAYMLASGLAGRGNIRGAELSLSLPDEIYASVPCAVEVRVSNKNRFTPIFLIDVTLEQGHETLFPVVQPGSTESMTLLTTFPSRGRRFFGNIELSSVYPFNFFTRYRQLDIDPEAIVFPHPLACEPEALFTSGPADEAEDDPMAADPMAETDIVGVRPYVEGDSMKRIHWKSSARTGKLKTRLYDGTASRRKRVIDVDNLIHYGVERGLSMAAYAVVESSKSGLPVGMIIEGELVPPASGSGHKKDLLTRLALYGER